MAGVTWIHRPIDVANVVNQTVTSFDVVAALVEVLVACVFRAVNFVITRVTV